MSAHDCVQRVWGLLGNCEVVRLTRKKMGDLKEKIASLFFYFLEKTDKSKNQQTGKSMKHSFNKTRPHRSCLNFCLRNALQLHQEEEQVC